MTKPAAPTTPSLKVISTTQVVRVQCEWCHASYFKGTVHDSDHCFCKQEYNRLSRTLTPVTTKTFLQFVRRIPMQLRGEVPGLFGIRNMLKVYLLEYSPIPHLSHTSLPPMLGAVSPQLPPVKRAFYGIWVHRYFKDLWECFDCGLVKSVTDADIEKICVALEQEHTHEILLNLATATPEAVKSYWKALLEGTCL